MKIINSSQEHKGFSELQTVKPFDNYEISGCREYQSVTRSFIEPVNHEAEARFWTLYGHTEGEGVSAIGHYATRAAAEKAYAQIVGEAFTGHYGANPALTLRNVAPDLEASLRDILSRFRSCIGCGGQIEGDHEAILNAESLLLLRRKLTL